MAVTKASCTACGAPVSVATSGIFAGVEVLGTLCAVCTDQQFLDGGGSVLTLRGELEESRFPLGKVTITPGAVALLAETAQHAVTFLERHVRGDWGEFGHYDEIHLTADEQRRGWEATDDTAKINKYNLVNGRDQIVSEFHTSRGEQLWVITSLEPAGGTTVLVPAEY
jgi:hypothetical protein